MMIPRLEVDPEAGLLIEWPDGHQSRYPFAVLRDMCPCAVCRDDRRPARGLRDTPALPIVRGAAASGPASAPTRLVRWDPIGNYAIGIAWADGHNSGIYSWDYLRDRCGCLGCRVERGKEER
jgi:DUF971 family protein